MTPPKMMIDTQVTHHIFGVSGHKNAHASESMVLTGATTTRPDSINGCVKSTILALLDVITISPTTASYTCHNI